MTERLDNEDKLNTVINVCLDQFVSKGLLATTSRDLSRALNLQSAGMYSYFHNKDEAVIACAEKAALKLEDALVTVALKDILSPDKMMHNLQEKAKQMAPMMRFFTQVCSTEKYEESIRPMLSNLSKRYSEYAVQFSEDLNVGVDEIKPYVYICITAITNYMVYQEDSYIIPQLAFVSERIEELIRKNEERFSHHV